MNKTKAVCPRCGGALEDEITLRDYTYYCPNCDENFYSFEIGDNAIVYSDLKIELVKVDCDNEGDKYWQWLATWRDKAGKEIYSDYYHKYPDEISLKRDFASVLEQQALTRTNDKQDCIESLRSLVRKGVVTTGEELDKLVERANEQGLDIESYDDILEPIEYNVCDRCNRFEPIEGLIWVDSYEWQDTPTDQKLLKAIQESDKDYCAICEICQQEMLK